MNLLFWNINKKPLANEIKSLCDCHGIDILILAENQMQDKDILPILNQNTNRFFIAPSHSHKISFYTRFHSFELVHDDNYWGSIRKITHPIGIEFLLVAVHVSSKLHQSDNNQAFLAKRIVDEIDRRKQQQGHIRTIVMGDFNMNPFESGLINADAFHAVMDKQITLKQTRTVLGVERKFFYNPMWSRLGDDSDGSAGSYYYDNSDMNNYFWNMFDQVLLRPSLLKGFNKNNLQIIEEINGVSLIKNGKISKDFSDHLPIMIKLSIPNLIGDK
jgi:exonuclease III